MTLRPGVQVQVLTTPPPRSAPTDTGVWFVVGTADQGRADAPILLRSMSDFTRLLGARVSYSLLYDALDVFFREGGSAAYVARVVGPAAVIASRNLVDNVAAVSLVVKAIGPGSYGNSLKVAVVAAVAGGNYKVQVYDSTNTLLEDSGDLYTQADAVAWSANSQYVRITLGASSLIPVVGGTNVSAALSGGNDDRNNIVDANWLTALNLFTRDLGPGNVSAPGQTTTTRYQQLADHAAANNRVALLDGPDTATSSTVTSSATNAKTTGHGQYAAIFAPWVVVPGVSPGTTRTVPPSAMAAGLMAAVDASDGPGTPAAGSKGVSRYATAVSQPAWDDTTRDTLNTAGVNVIRVLFGTPTLYGYRSLADPTTNPYWVPLGTVRYLMGLGARAWAVGQEFVFDEIDGQGHTISAYQGALVALCQVDWAAGEIYGATPGEAFNVDTGPGINTPTVLAGNELRAAISVRPSPMAELVTIQIVNVPITQEVS
jgi:phage tail sheath protein FI